MCFVEIQNQASRDNDKSSKTRLWKHGRMCLIVPWMVRNEDITSHPLGRSPHRLAKRGMGNPLKSEALLEMMSTVNRRKSKTSRTRAPQNVIRWLMVSFGGFGQPGAIDRTSVSAQLMVVIVGRKVVGSLPGPSLLLLLGHSLSSYLDDGAFPVLQDTNGSTFSTTCCRGWSNVYASIVLPHYAVCSRKLLEES